MITMARHTNVNQMSTELLSIHAMNFAALYNPPPRGTMFAGHFAQRLVTEGTEPNLVQTGVEEEFGKYTFAVKMPEDGTILLVLPKYPTTIGNDQINFNPETTVIYQSHDTGELNYFTLPYYASYHPTFGFKYREKPAERELAVNKEFAKDTVFRDSPAITGDTHYTFGRNLNVVVMSHPNVGLDGYVISRDVLPHLGFKMYESRSVSFGASEFPLNTHGDDNNYKSFPELGDEIREDGLLFATRRTDAYMAPALLSVKDTQTIDHLFDNKIYVRAGKGRVVDITVIKSNNINLQLPEQMTKQFEKYARATLRYYSDIVNFEEDQIRINKRNGGEGLLNINPKLQQLIVESKSVLNYRGKESKQDIVLAYRKEPLDGWLVNFTVEYDVVPNRGFKATCSNGGGLKYN